MSLFDPFQPVIPGTAKQPIAARTWNGLLKAGQANSRSKFDLTTGQGGSPTDPALTIIVRNDTGGYLPSQSILRPVDALVDPSQLPDQSQQQPVFTGEAVAAATDPFVVTTEIAGDGCFVESVVSGLAVCTVVISDASHKRAVPVAGVTTHLVSAASGGVPIWWTPGGTGTKVCLVLLSGIGGGEGVSARYKNNVTTMFVSGGASGIPYVDLPTGTFLAIATVLFVAADSGCYGYCGLVAYSGSLPTGSSATASGITLLGSGPTPPIVQGNGGMNLIGIVSNSGSTPKLSAVQNLNNFNTGVDTFRCDSIILLPLDSTSPLTP